MQTKILIIDSATNPLNNVRNFFSNKQCEIVKQAETESIFSISKKEKLSAIIIDNEVFGKKHLLILKNLKENVVKDIPLISISNEDKSRPDLIFQKLSVIA